MSKFGSKTIIKGYVNNLSEYLKEAEALNTQLLGLVHESEHEAVLIWYEEQLERVNDAKLEAESHLEGAYVKYPQSQEHFLACKKIRKYRT